MALPNINSPKQRDPLEESIIGTWRISRESFGVLRKINTNLIDIKESIKTIVGIQDRTAEQLQEQTDREKARATLDPPKPADDKSSGSSALGSIGRNLRRLMPSRNWMRIAILAAAAGLFKIFPQEMHKNFFIPLINGVKWFVSTITDVMSDVFSKDPQTWLGKFLHFMKDIAVEIDKILVSMFGEEAASQIEAIGLLALAIAPFKTLGLTFKGMRLLGSFGKWVVGFGLELLGLSKKTPPTVPTGTVPRDKPPAPKSRTPPGRANRVDKLLKMLRMLKMPQTLRPPLPVTAVLGPGLAIGGAAATFLGPAYLAYHQRPIIKQKNQRTSETLLKRYNSASEDEKPKIAEEAYFHLNDFIQKDFNQPEIIDPLLRVVAGLSENAPMDNILSDDKMLKVFEKLRDKERTEQLINYLFKKTANDPSLTEDQKLQALRDLKQQIKGTSLAGQLPVKSELRSLIRRGRDTAEELLEKFREKTVEPPVEAVPQSRIDALLNTIMSNNTETEKTNPVTIVAPNNSRIVTNNNNPTITVNGPSYGQGMGVFPIISPSAQ